MFCEILDKNSKNCQRSLKFGHSGKISPNTVTLADCLHIISTQMNAQNVTTTTTHEKFETGFSN